MTVEKSESPNHALEGTRVKPRALQRGRYAMKCSSTLLLIALVFWAAGSVANPIAVPMDIPAQAGSRGPYVAVAAICAIALLAESVCIAFLSGRRSIASIYSWFVVTTLTFLTFVVIPLSVWPEYAPKDLASALSWPVFFVELAIILSEAFVLWVMWYPRSVRGWASAIRISAIGNAVSLTISLVLFALVT